MGRTNLADSFTAARHEHDFTLCAIFQGEGGGDERVNVVVDSLH